MKPSEIEELLDLKDWTRTKLAAELDVTENSVHGWVARRRNPRARHVKKMRQWLEEARAQAAVAR